MELQTGQGRWEATALPSGQEPTSWLLTFPTRIAQDLANGAGAKTWMVEEASSIAGVPDTTSQAFQVLVQRWRSDTTHFSSVSKAAMHPAYQRIIGLGQRVVPLLLHELRERPDHWFWALRAITGQNPVAVEHAGDVKEMTRAWLRWGRQNGYFM